MNRALKSSSNNQALYAAAAAAGVLGAVALQRNFWTVSSDTSDVPMDTTEADTGTADGNFPTATPGAILSKPPLPGKSDDKAFNTFRQ